MDSIPFMPDAAAISSTKNTIAVTFLFEVGSVRQGVIALSELEEWLSQVLQDAIDQNQSGLGSI